MGGDGVGWWDRGSGVDIGGGGGWVVVWMLCW